MTPVRLMFRLALTVALATSLIAQTLPARKRLLVIGEEKGYRHEAVTHAMVTIERLGRETGASCAICAPRPLLSPNWLSRHTTVVQRAECPCR